MRVLGIDYGKAKLGLSIGDSKNRLAEPLKVIKYVSQDEVKSTLNKIVLQEGIENIVIGLPSGGIGELAREFGASLTAILKIPVIYHDETLSTIDAQKKSISSGINRKKRRAMEDAYAAAIILQDYFDSAL